MDKTALIDKTGQSELLRFLGVEIDTAEPDRVVLKMEVTPRVHQYTGIMNGGVSVYLAETAASIGVVVGADLEKVTPVGNRDQCKSLARGKPRRDNRRRKAHLCGPDTQRLGN